MKRATRASLTCTTVAVILGLGAAYAQQTFESTACRAGTMTVLAKAEDMIVWSVDLRGVIRGNAPNNPFDGNTQRCVGVVANIAGKTSANGWCKNVGPKNDDWYVLDWVASDKPGHGTFTYRYGAGKWKGITGGGSYEPAGQTTPVEPGTFQNCVNVKGTAKIPG